MPTFGPIKRSLLIRHLKKSGFEGPYVGANHQYMQKGSMRVTIPNPHEGDIDKSLLAKVLRQAGISKEEWEKL